MKKLRKRMRSIAALALVASLGISNVQYVYAADETSTQESSTSDELEAGILTDEKVTEDAAMETGSEDVQETVPSEETTENIQENGSDESEDESVSEEQSESGEVSDENAMNITGAADENAMDTTGVADENIMNKTEAEEAMDEQEASAAEPRTDYFLNYGNWIGADNGDGTFTLVGCRALSEYVDDKTLRIPSTVEGMTVTNIRGDQGSGIFNIFDPQMVETIIFPDTVESISGSGGSGWEDVFEKFINLKTVYLPNNPDCYIDGSQFPRTMNDAGDFVTPIEHIYLGQMNDFSELFGPWGLTCGIKTLTVYDGITEFDMDDRDGLPDLETINLPESMERFGFSDAPKLTTLNCPKSLNSIHFTHLDGCKELQVEITITSEWDYMSYDFQDSGITKVTIKSDALKHGLDKSAFRGCKYLREFYVEPGSEFHSEDGVLWWNNDIHTYPAAKSHAGNYNVPSNVECIYYHAFDNAKFTSITFPEIMNSEFYWDRPMIPNEPTMFENNNMKVRVVPQSAAANDWYEGEEADFAAYQKIDPSRVEFYKGSTYKINYNLNGGKNAAGNPTSYRAGDNVVTLKNPTKEGYEFVRWDRNDGDDSGTTIIWDGKFQDFTFTAVWSQKDAPGSVNNLKANSQIGGVKLTWSAAKDAEGYLIYGKTASGKYGYIGMTTSLQYTDRKASTDEYNFYWVFAYSKDKSGDMILGPTSDYVYSKAQKCKAVTNLKASSLVKGVKLTWDKVTGAEGYLIYGQVNGNKYGYVGMTTKALQYTDKHASPSMYNFYWVFPYYKNVDGKMVTGATAKYVYGKAQICKAVTNLKATSVSGGVKLSWEKSPEAEGYLVYGQVNGGKYGYVGMTTKALQYTDKKASSEVYNFYWVFPFYYDFTGKMIVGGTPQYVYGRAR